VYGPAEDLPRLEELGELLVTIGMFELEVVFEGW
jgi:hypothetical protein